MNRTDSFASRWGMMLAMLGMAVGTGNIWRFPRIAAQNGGGEFLIAWIAFLFLWSIPLILLEFGMGRKLRCGPIRAFLKLMGPRWVWMGAFMVVVTSGILCYYSVVAGWTLHYVFASGAGSVPEAHPGAHWESFRSSWWPGLTHALMIGGACFVVARGVSFIERVAKVLMPALLVLVGVLTVRALTLPGAEDGLSYLFSVDWARLSDGKLWLEALTQNAWDTGAGWGLVLCYAAYLPPREDTAQNAFLLPTANNLVSLTAGAMVLCTIFSVVPGLVEGLETRPEALASYPELAQAVSEGAGLSPDLLQETIFSSNNEGLTFVWMPQLFASLPLGRVWMVFFFVALSFAAFTSLVSMVELATRTLVDAKVTRGKAVAIVATVGFSLGLPSVYWRSFLANQDWVWAVALMLAGLFLALSIRRYGIRRFREEQLNHEDSRMRVGRWWDFVIGTLVPVQAIVLFGWWLYQAWTWDEEGWLEPFGVMNVGTVLFQFALVFGLLFALNGWIARRSAGEEG